jgi:putative nucleotidyltransferase with HDIG domain
MTDAVQVSPDTPELPPFGMTRQQALDLLHSRVEAINLRRHCYASEAIMRAVCRQLGWREDDWGLAALLHDLDFSETGETPERHGTVTAEVLRERGVPEAYVSAILAHNAENLGGTRDEAHGIALACSEQITGLVVATALVYPDKKLASVKPKSVIKRMKEKAFARNVDRDVIRECERIGIPLSEFAALSVEAMCSIADELGL